MNKVSAKQLFESFDTYIVVDLREMQSFQLYRIPYSYPFSQCHTRIKKAKKTVCFVCRNGEESCQLTKQFPNTVYLDGGLIEWIKYDYDDIILKQYSNRELCEGECCEC